MSNVKDGETWQRARSWAKSQKLSRNLQSKEKFTMANKVTRTVVESTTITGYP